MKQNLRIFRDRTHAGQELAKKLSSYANRSDVIVLALPRGGVPVGFEIAKTLYAPLDAFLVRKLGVPGHEELAMGAIAMGDVRVLNEDVVRSLHIPKDTIEEVTQREAIELERRNQVYRAGRPIPELKGRIVILVDDGLATGATMRAAVRAVKVISPAKIVVAVPVAPIETYHEFKKIVDDIICVEMPEFFYSISQWYEYFPQTSDEEVIELLKRAKDFVKGNTHEN